MGRKATITSAVQRHAHERREHYAQKSTANRQQQQQHRSNDAAAAATASSAVVAAPPTPAQAEFLVKNAADALRISRTSDDLRRLFISWVSAPTAAPASAAPAQAQAQAEEATASTRRRGRGAEPSAAEAQSAQAELQKKWHMIAAVLEAVQGSLVSLVVDDLSSGVICAVLPAATRIATDLGDTAVGAAAPSNSASAAGKKAAASSSAAEQLAEIVDKMIATIEASAERFTGDIDDAAASSSKKSKKNKKKDDDDDAAGNNNGDDDAEEEDDDEDKSGIAALARHQVGRRVMCALLEASNDAQRKQLNKVLAARTLSLVTHRHGSVVLMRLLQLYPKAARTIAPAVLAGLEAYLADPIAEKVAEMIITAKTVAPIIVDGILPSLAASKPSREGRLLPALLENKRWVRFLIQVLDQGVVAAAEAGSEEAATAALSQLIDALAPHIPLLNVEERGNLLVQALIRAAAAAFINAPQQARALAKLALTPPPLPVYDEQQQYGNSSNGGPRMMTVADLLVHPHAAHVVGQLASAGGEAMSGEVSAVLRPHLMQLVTNKHGSIAVRRFVEAGQGAQQQPDTYQRAETLLDAVSSGASGAANVQRLLSDEFGNIVLQAMLRCARQPRRVAFFKQFVKPRLLELCKDAFASHVVHMLLDSYMLDAQTHADVCTALERHAVELAQHLNGRFIVEQLVVPSQKVQRRLLDAFAELAAARGSQGLMTRLYEASSRDVRQAIAAKVAAELGALATVQASSMVVQKLLTADLQLLAAQRQQDAQALQKVPEVWNAVRTTLGLAAGAAADSNASRLLQQLRGDFFGRFVVQLAQSNTPPPPPAQVLKKERHQQQQQQQQQQHHQ